MHTHTTHCSIELDNMAPVPALTVYSTRPMCPTGTTSHCSMNIKLLNIKACEAYGIFLGWEEHCSCCCMKVHEYVSMLCM